MKQTKAPKRRPPARAKPNLWTGRAAAAGWLVLAGTILAWPRQESLSHRFWRAFGDGARRLRGVPANAVGDVRGRGAGADSPAEIPLPGWKDIAVRTWSEFNKDRIPAVAAGVAFFALLSLFPAMAAFVSLYGLFADVNVAEKQLTALSGVLPRDTLNFIGDQMLRFAQRGSGQLSFAFAFSFLLSLWSANGAVKALFDGLNVAYEQREKRSFIALNLISLTFTVGGLVFITFALSAVVATPSLFAWIGYKHGLPWLTVLRWPVLLAAAVTALSVLYRYGPSRKLSRWRWITWGGVIAAVLWLFASMLFSWYVGAFAHYDRTYGSLGAVVAAMTWIWLSTTIVLAGAEMNSEVEAQSSVDTSIDGRAP